MCERTNCVVTASICVLLAAGSAVAQPHNRLFGSRDAEFAESVTAAVNSDRLFAGYKYGPPTFDAQVYVARTFGDGTPLWDVAFGFPNRYEEAFSVREAISNNITVGFVSPTQTFPAEDLCLAGLSPTGVVLWTKRYEGGGNFSTRFGMELDTFSAMVAGEYVGFDVNQELRSSGQLLRASVFDGSVGFNYSYSTDPLAASGLRFSDVALFPDGDYFVTGEIGVLPQAVLKSVPDADILVARIDRNGDPVWCRAYSMIQEDNRPYEYGTGIALNAAGEIVVVGRTNDPTDPSGLGPAAALHLLLDPTNGNVLANNVITDIQLASASLHRISTGEIVASGSRTFGDGDAAAQMWILEPNSLDLYWRAEYGPDRALAGDAIEHIGSDRGLVLTGNTPNFQALPPLGYYEALDIRANMMGDDLCSASIWYPEPIHVEIRTVAIELSKTALSLVSEYPVAIFQSAPSSALRCEQVCRADFNNSGAVDFFDYLDFVDAFSLGDPSADFNNDFGVDFFDYLDFVDAFSIGC